MNPRSTIVQALYTTAMLLVAIGCAAPSNEEKPVPITSEFSQLTDAGIAEIEESRHARFDLRNRELTKAAVGLDGQDRGPIVGGADKPMITLELLGPEHTETVQTSTIMFLSASADTPYEGIVFWKSFDTTQDCLAELRTDISRWGIRAEDVDRWERNSQAETDYQQVISMGVGRSGLVAGVEARLKNGNCLLKYDIYLEPRYYAPEVQDMIRRTGSSR
ncbi:hypothetical protein [Nocardia otitidiscaviarum]|uniref:hypothetical protein n=1 Tax=Nocardia otitidiscaviarum TaxID=1823 RepID=UPI0024582BFD|nr:hypothetical protein [Nocardia otitidiscaviarum]